MEQDKREEIVLRGDGLGLKEIKWDGEKIKQDRIEKEQHRDKMEQNEDKMRQSRSKEDIKQDGDGRGGGEGMTEHSIGLIEGEV